MKVLFRVIAAALLLSLLLGGMGTPVKVQAADPAVIEIAETITVTDSPELVPQLANNPPTVTYPIPDQVKYEAEAFTYTLPSDTFNDVDAGDSLTYAATLVGGDPLPSFLTFDAGTATFSISPDYNSAGYYDIEVTATDQSGASVSDTFRITVINTNREPELVVTPDLSLYTVDENPAAALIITISFSDPDGDTVTVQASGLPAFVTASPAFPGTTSPVTLTIDPGCNDYGFYSIVLTAADNDPVEPKSVLKTLNIQVLQTNCPGTLAFSTDNPPLTINENTLVSYQLALTDPEDDGIASVSIVSQQPDDALNATAIKSGDDWYISLTADYNAAKQNASQDYTITVQATDTGSPAGVLSNQLSFTVTVCNFNCPPVLTVTPVETTSNEGETVQFALSGSDPDAEDVALWITILADTPDAQNVPVTGTLDVQLRNSMIINVTSTSWRLDFTPDYTQNGDYLFKATLYDRDPFVGSGLTDSETFILTVNQVNDPPVADDQSVTTVENTTVSITLTAADIDGDLLTYLVVDGPSHGTLAGTAPSLTYTPVAGYTGPDSFTFKTNDGIGDIDFKFLRLCP